jgi:hypothetical protein
MPNFMVAAMGDLGPGVCCSNGLYWRARVQVEIYPPLGLVGVQASILLGVKSALVFNWVFVQFPPRRRVAFDPMFGVRIRSIAC